MKLIPESNNLNDYLSEIPFVIEFNTPMVHAKVKEIQDNTNSNQEAAEMAFEISRDEIKHSFDIPSSFVSITGEDALKSGEGICFAKSHLFATLLRAMEIPCGFCYQRVLRKGTIESGYALHGLNAVYLEEFGWFRLDPRGNKEGVNSQFSIEEEKLAYPIREKLGEVDYPTIYTKPLANVLLAMKDSKNSEELFFKRPEKI